MNHSSKSGPKNILLISYNFPGVKTDGMGVGKLRPGKLSKQLAEKGHNVSVICGPRDKTSTDYVPLPSESVRHVEAFIPPKFWEKYNPERQHVSSQEIMGLNVSPESLPTNRSLLLKHNLKYLVKHCYPLSNVRLPEKAMFWRKKAYKLAKVMLHESKTDTVISCSGPPSAAIIASKLKKDFEIKWIADFRDLWSLNHYDDRIRIFKYFEKRYEKKILSRADHLVIISSSLRKQMSELHDTKTCVIESGFDDDESRPEVELDKEQFRILYTGQVYPDYNPSPLFEAMASILKTEIQYRKKIQIDFYGNETVSRIRRFVHDHLLKRVVNYHDSIPRDQILRLQKQASVLLLLIWRDKFAKGVITAKVFEYLAARRPILALGFKGGDLEDILKETESGIILNDPGEIKGLLLKWLEMFFKKKDYNLGFNLNKEKVSKYSSKNMGEKFLKLI